MKKYLSVFILFAASLLAVSVLGTISVFAQNSKEVALIRTMRIYKGDSVHRIAVSDIDSIKFTMDKVIPAMKDSSFVVNGVSFTMKSVWGSTFKMGAQAYNPNGVNYDSAAADDESPIHNVTLSDFYMGETEVTQELWIAVMGKWPNAKVPNADFGLGNNYPAYFICRNDIVGIADSGIGYTVNGIDYYKNGFCYKLSQLVGGDKKFRLPTEAEWEYAARGGAMAETQTKYSGSNIIEDVAWYNGNSGNKTHPVGTKQANALGLYDMTGNIRELCGDYLENYKSADQTNPVGQGSAPLRVVCRGGFYGGAAIYCRVSFRSFSGLHVFSQNDGFRLAL